MTKVVFFSNQFARKNSTGVARYAHNLLRGFTQLETPPQVFPVATWSDRDQDDLNILTSTTGLRLLPTGRWLTPLLWMSLGYPKIEHLLGTHVDIVHACDLGIQVATSKPYVVTIHDIGPLIHPEYFPKESNWVMRKNLAYAVKKASAFICVSQATADSLLEYVQERLAVDIASRTYVAHEGVTEQFLQIPNLNVGGRFDFMQEPYLLAVGKISPRKNLEVALKALKELQTSLPHHLVTVGGDGWDFQEVKNLVGSLELEDRVHFLGYVNDETLHALYSKAALLIYPSLFEGFGLTILEAMASGCPVVTSNIPSLAEVAGDAAMLVDPKDISTVVAAIQVVCNDAAIADELRRKGRERVKTFSWRKCAEDISAIYSTIKSG